jgi:hypothetical protein
MRTLVGQLVLLAVLATLAAACGHATPDKPAAPPTVQKRRVKATPLTRDDIVAGFEPVKPRAQACFAQHGASGTVFVRVKIAPSGKVDARTLGPLRGSRASACFERAVRQAAFRPSTGMLIDYPFRP